MVDLVAWTVLRVKDDVLDADPRVSKVAVPSAVQEAEGCLLF